MIMRDNAAPIAAQETRARPCGKKTNKYANAARQTLATTLLLQFLIVADSAQAGIRQSANTPLQQFGFSTIGQVQTAPQFIQFFNTTKQVLGIGAIVRTGLGWDPTRQTAPGFPTWSAEVLEPALARGITILPGIRTLNVTQGGYRMPTDAQWENGLRWIVRMYGPNGIYQKGGSYIMDGRTVQVDPHPSFKGLTDYELWNEPNTQGNLNGAMTPARMVHLLKIGAAAMRAEAARLGFKINVIGPAIGGINIDYLMQLWMTDNNLFSYIDTLSVHAYTRFSPSQCDAFGSKKYRCIASFGEMRKFMDSHGGGHVHIGTTEGGVAGDRGGCTGPQVKSEEEQRDYMVANLEWLRARPYLDFDFWITPKPVDGTRRYGYACNSGEFDIPYWEAKLGVIRPDMTLKPWGARYRDLVNAWKSP
jgi:hypothetical protein